MSKTIILAEDDIDDRLLFTEALHQVDDQIDLITADNGEDLLGILAEHLSSLPDLIILDINMPIKNGYDTLSAIRASPALKDIPVVILTTSSEQRSIDEMYRRGANHYISKPYSFNELKKVVDKLLSIDWSSVKTQPGKEEFVMEG